MKKLFAVVILAFLIAGGAAAATVTVTKPTANETWVKGQTSQILWTKSGNMPDTVRITLRDKTGATEIKLIGDNKPNSGSYSWPVPQDVPDGQYVVRVKVKNVAVSDDSDVFNIAAASVPSITVTNPAAGDKWNRDKAYNITWAKNGTMPNSVKIDLLNSAGMIIVKPIADGVPNSGSYSWTVPAETTFADYRVRVQVKTTQIQDSSEIFSVAVPKIPVAQKSPSTLVSPLKVISPHDNSVATAASILPIKFEADINLGTVEILLYDEFKNHQIWAIADQASFGQGQQCPPVGPDFPNQYVYNWEVPYDEAHWPGTFAIRIRRQESGGPIAWSDKFKIIWPMKEHEYEFDATVNNIICIKDPEGLTPPPVRPECEATYDPKRVRVGWDVFDYVGSLGISPPYWRAYVHYARLKFPLEQFMGKNTALLKAQLRIKKACTSNINTTRASAAYWLSRLKEALPQGGIGMAWAQCQAMQKEPLYILPDNLTEASYNVQWTVQDWILQRNPYHGFLVSPANTDPPYYAAQTCKSTYTVKLYIKTQEEFKGYTTN